MDIQFVNQFFWPDRAATSQLLGDVAVAATRLGKVVVVCGPAQYAADSEAISPNGVIVRRFRSTGFGHGIAQKSLSYASFAVGALSQMLFGSRADVVVTMTTPPLLGVVGWIAQLRGSRHYIWEMDVYPDVAVELGIFKRGSAVDRVTGWLADFPRRRADGIIALGPCMAERLRGRSIGSVPIHIVHNWADGEALVPQKFFRDGRLKVFYSGNMGLAHDFDTVIPVVSELDAGFRFRFSGGGPLRKGVESALMKLPHCEFSGYHGRSDLGAAFAKSDVGLVTQRAESIGTVVPSKVYGILAAGRGVLFVGPRDSTVGRIISEYGVGWQVGNGNCEGLRRLLWELRLRPEMVEATGRRARLVFEREFSKTGQVEKILRIITAESAAPTRSEVA